MYTQLKVPIRVLENGFVRIVDRYWNFYSITDNIGNFNTVISIVAAYRI